MDDRASKSSPPPPPPLAEGLHPPLHMVIFDDVLFSVNFRFKTTRSCTWYAFDEIWFTTQKEPAAIRELFDQYCGHYNGFQYPLIFAFYFAFCAEIE